MNDTTNEIAMDSSNLYREEIVTDRRVGSIHVMHPIKTDGSDDSERNTLFVGQAQMLTPMGAIPLNFEIEADTLEAAIEKFPEEANQALERTAQELQELRREQASSIVVPGAGDMPGSGKIQLK